MSSREGIVVEEVEREEEMIMGEEERRAMRSRRGIRDILTERKQVRHHPGVIIPPAYYCYSHIPHYMLYVSANDWIVSHKPSPDEQRINSSLNTLVIA